MSLSTWTPHSSRKGPPSICEECNESPALYACPRCRIRTCSLGCCNAHKTRTGCNGKRNRTEFLPVSRMTDATMRSDYFFLEDVWNQLPSNGCSSGRLDGNSKRPKRNPGRTINERETSSTTTITPSYSHKDRRLIQQAQTRGVTLQIMPSFMQRHKLNKTWHSGKTNIITWMIELLVIPEQLLENETSKTEDYATISFTLAEDEKPLFDQVVRQCVKHNGGNNGSSDRGTQNKNQKPSKDNNVRDDDDKEHSAIQQFLTNQSNFQLLLAKLPSSQANRRYIRLDHSSSVRECLQGQTIIEYPTIYCVPTKQLHKFPTVGIVEVQHHPQKMDSNLEE